MKAHPFERYFRKHGHYPRLRLDNGVQRMTVEFAPGYVRIKTSSPFGGEVYITRSAWFRMLQRAIPLTRQWSPHEDFDVPQQVREDYLEEMVLADELRAQKRARKRTPDPDEADRRERQKARHARAVARAARRQRDPDYEPGAPR